MRVAHACCVRMYYYRSYILWLPSPRRSFARDHYRRQCGHAGERGSGVIGRGSGWYAAAAAAAMLCAADDDGFWPASGNDC